LRPTEKSGIESRRSPKRKDGSPKRKNRSIERRKGLAKRWNGSAKRRKGPARPSRKLAARKAHRRSSRLRDVLDSHSPTLRYALIWRKSGTPIYRN
jgi:hypothetical protein